MKFNPDYHHRKSVRLRSHNYGRNNTYFVTICAYKKEFFFGELKAGQVIYNDWGRIVIKSWDKIPDHFPAAKLGRMILMPNHLHGIISIQNFGINGGGEACLAPTLKATSAAAPTLGTIIGLFKATVTKRINIIENRSGTIWQRNYYERILRDKKELKAAIEYIRSNPRNWLNDPEKK